MAEIAIVTDSSSYLPDALIDRLEVTVVSGYYDLGDGPLRESEFDGDLPRFYAQLDASKTVASTSPPPVEDFIKVFEPLLEQHSAVVAITVSSAVSEVCTLARQAAAELAGRGGERVTVIDSAGACGHLGVQVIAAARAAAARADVSRVLAVTHRVRQEVGQWSLLDTLEYLRRSGRIGTAVTWIASALDLKPILTMESEIRAVERVRTRKRGIERLVELMSQRRAVGADRWFVQHAAAPEDAQRLVDRLGEMFGTEPEFTGEVGPIFATHVGPGALLVGGFPSAALDGADG